jgi:hypothetical protein
MFVDAFALIGAVGAVTLVYYLVIVRERSIRYGRSMRKTVLVCDCGAEVVQESQEERAWLLARVDVARERSSAQYLIDVCPRCRTLPLDDLVARAARR